MLIVIKTLDGLATLSPDLASLPDNNRYFRTLDGHVVSSHFLEESQSGGVYPRFLKDESIIYLYEMNRLLGGASGTADQFDRPPSSPSCNDKDLNTCNASLLNISKPSSSGSPSLSTHSMPCTSMDTTITSSNSGPFGSNFTSGCPLNSSDIYSPFGLSSFIPSGNIGSINTSTIPSTFNSSSGSMSSSLTPSIQPPLQKRNLVRSKCHVDGCLDRVVSIIGDCTYCRKKFCSGHRLPELHICSELEACKTQSLTKLKDKLMKERCVPEKL